jgi:hypothetical protein
MRWVEKLDLTCICFQKKLTHHCFKSSSSIRSRWIDRADFLHFWKSKIHVGPTSIISSLSPPRCHLSSGRCLHTAASCHSSFSWSHDELDASASLSGNISSCPLPSRAKTEALNLHHHCWPPLSDHLTPTLHCYKKVMSTLASLPATQLCLHFASSLARAPRHQSSTCHRRSLLPLSHTHHPCV